MNALKSLCAAAAAVALLSATPARAASDPFQMASPEEVSKMLGQPDVKVFDANPPEVYAKAHLPGATFVETGSLASALPKDKSTRLVFYCKNPK